MYDLFKFLHVLGAMVWIGAGITFLILNTRLARARDAAGITALASQGEWFGKAVFSTSAMVTLVAGIVTVLVSDGQWSFADAWISVGFVGVALSIVFGAVLSQRAARDLEAVAASDGATSPAAAAIQRRLNLLGTIDVVILVSVVAAMVWKPGS